MLKERLLAQVDRVIGPRLRFWRLMSFSVVVVLEGMAQASVTVSEASRWPTAQGIENVLGLVGDMPLGHLVLIFVAVFFIGPKVAALLLSQGAAWAMAFAEPMFDTLYSRMTSDSEQPTAEELGRWIRCKHEALRWADAIVDAFEMAVVLGLWVVWPGSVIEFGVIGLLLAFAVFVVVWLCAAYSLNYLIVTRVVPCDLLQQKHAECGRDA
ncbi:hypothetical protein LRF89_00015 [Halorhodospira sp. 9621]|uniref:hypothetical protein n=1 Tax=Halorhodospira sp. 9621 TaxID=2899135 RepID=UPI001EE89CDB|nr:hypothetical protein [Halorhodospira sp. 9621]MCG5531820.1 hypothetical protein [Halorhodospira sp. 9621]